MNQEIKTDEGLVVIGIDPSSVRSGWCLISSKGVKWGSCKMAEIASVDFTPFVNEGDVVVLIIEKPARMYRGSNHVVRSVGNAWLDHVKRMFPRRVKHLDGHPFIDPEEWRRHLLVGAPGNDWKGKALWYMKSLLAHPSESLLACHDEAEAFCLAVHAKIHWELVSRIPKIGVRKRPRQAR